MHRPIAISSMRYRVSGVQRADISKVWTEAGLLLSDALARSREGYTLGEVREQLEDGRGMLWLVRDGDGALVGALVAYIHGRRNTLVVWLMAGRDFEDWRGEVQSLLARYAAEQQLQGVEAWVRPGLARKLSRHGWREQQRLVRLGNGR